MMNIQKQRINYESSIKQLENELQSIIENSNLQLLFNKLKKVVMLKASKI